MARRKVEKSTSLNQAVELRNRRKTLFVLLSVFTAALLARVIYVLQVRTDPFFSFPIIDSQMYDVMARNYAQGKPLYNKAFFWPPLYPWFLGVLYSLIGHTYLGVRLVQALLGALSCMLLYGIGRKAFDHRTGLAAASVMAVYGTLVYFDGEILAPNLYIFLLLSGLLLLQHAHEKTSGEGLALWFGAGLVHGLAALARPNILLFLPLAALWVGGAGTSVRGVRKLLRPTLFLVGAASVVLCVTVRNYAVERDIVLISSNGGINFYLGNNPDAARTVAIRPGYRWIHLAEEAKRAGITRSSASSWYYFRKGISFIREDPGAALSLVGVKLAHLWNSFEIGRNRDVYGTRQHSSLLSVLLWGNGPFGFPFGLIAPLAFAGMIVSVSWDRPRLLLYLFCLAYLISVILFFATSRYRLPVIPILILFAAQYVLWLFERMRSRRLRPILLSLVPLFIMVPTVNRGYESLDRLYKGETDRFLGIYYTKEGRQAEAEAAYRRALEGDPDYAEVHAELGQLLLDRGHSEEALGHLARARELCPYSEETNLLLAAGLEAVGRAVEAETQYRISIGIAPYGSAPRELGIHLLKQGRSNEAEEFLVQATRVRPNDLKAWYRLTECYFRQDELEKMEGALLTALRLATEDSPIMMNLTKLRALLSSLQEKSAGGAAEAGAEP